MRAEVQRRPYSRVGRFDALPYDMEMGLVRLLQHEIDFIRRMNMLVKDIEQQPDFSTYAAFRTVDRFGEGSVHVANLQDFFRGFGCYLVDTEVFAVIRRIDTDGDARLSYEEFAEFLSSQVNVEASLLHQPPAKQQKRRKAGDHRGDFFETDSKLGANIERSLNQSARRSLGRSGARSTASALQVSP